MRRAAITICLLSIGLTPAYSEVSPGSAPPAARSPGQTPPNGTAPAPRLRADQVPSSGVIQPGPDATPDATVKPPNVDPGMTIPPPGTPGGNPRVIPK
jgi:hypothetical protein